MRVEKRECSLRSWSLDFGFFISYTVYQVVCSAYAVNANVNF